jgi:site-specific DNA recombinase
LDEGIRIVELSQRAHELFIKQESREKRRLLNFLLSNCSWGKGELKPTFRQPFNMISEMNLSSQNQKATSQMKSGPFENWLPE